MDRSGYRIIIFKNITKNKVLVLRFHGNKNVNTNKTKLIKISSNNLVNNSK